MLSRLLKNRLSFTLFTILFIFLITSCDNSKETIEDKVNDVKNKTEDVINESAEKASDLVDDATEVMEKENENEFLLGVWVGKFDSRFTTLKIENVDGNEFVGKITINYRDVINQEIEGSIDPTDNSVKMEDQLHSRFRGNYSGKITDNNSVFSGVFTMDRNNSKFNFSLKKK